MAVSLSTCKNIPVQYSPDVEITLNVGYELHEQWYKGSEIDTKKWWVDNIKPEWNIIDAGANVGMFSVLFGTMANQVFCFEPTDNANLLIENCKDFYNVEVIRKALSCTSGNRQDKVYMIWKGGDGPLNAVFEFITIDDFVEERSLKIDALKIDVDSYDYEVLLGAEKTLAMQGPIVIVELNNALELRGHNKQMAVEFMSKCGYGLKCEMDAENYLFEKT